MTTWGTAENGQSIGINSWWTKNGSNVTLTQEIRYKSTIPVTDGNNTTGWSGHVSGTQANALDVNYWTGETVLKTLTNTFAIPTGSALTKSLSAYISGIEYISDGRVDVSESNTYYGFPNKATSASATRVSDSQINLAWTNNSTAGAPYQSIRIKRWDNVSNAWTTIATIGVLTSYSDTTAQANRKYQYEIYSENSTGTAGAVTTGFVYTTPSAPSGLSATKSGTAINLAWTNNSTIQDAVEVWHGTVSGGVTTWDGSALATLGATATSYSHTNPNLSQVHVYRVKASVSGLSSGYATSNTVQLLAAPLAPTVTLSHSVIDWSLTSFTISWVHNPQDSTAQSGAKIQYREVGTSTWTTVTKTTQTSHVITNTTLANPKNYEFQVATKGEHADYGSWSASKMAQGSATPTVSLTPSGTYGSSQLTVGLSYFDAESTAMANSIVTLKQGSTVLETKTGTATSVIFATKLLNSTAYTVEAKVQDGSGLWSQTETSSLNTVFLNPPKPVLSLSFNADMGYVVASVTTPVPVAGEVGADHVIISRWDDSLGWVLVAENIYTNGSGTDWIPPLGVDVIYKATAVSLTPSTRDSDSVTVNTSTPWIFLNGGSGFGTVARLKAGADIQREIGRSKVLHTFAGQEDATEFVGTERKNSFRVSGNVGGFERTIQFGDYEAFETVADLPAPVCFRDPMGRRMFSSLSNVQIGHSVTSGMATVSFTVSKVGYRE